MINDFIKENYEKMTKKELSVLIKEKFGVELSNEGIRKRWSRLKHKKTEFKQEPSDFTEYRADGLMEIQRKIYFDYDEKDKSPEAILRKMGYNPDEWEIIKLRFGTWEVAIKTEDENRLCTTARAEIKPKQKEITPEEALKVARELFDSGLKPFKFPVKKEDKTLNPNKLMEKPPVELHLGDLSCEMDTGENYDHKIAQKRYRHIVSEVVHKQQHEKCDTLLMSIGSDFFNTDTFNNTTTKGTPQVNDTRWRKMYLVGLQLTSEAIQEYKKHFNKIEIQLVSGNHDLTTSFYLYVTLNEIFRNDTQINFKQDYKEVQCHVWGDCMIVTTHGNKNVNRTLDSIPSEFPFEYGKTKFREVHFQHLHSEQEMKERLGIIPRRLSSPKGRGDWEYNERYGRSIQKQQIFVWEKGIGLTNIGMIPFEPEKDKKKQLIKK